MGLVNWQVGVTFLCRLPTYGRLWKVACNRVPAFCSGVFWPTWIFGRGPGEGAVEDRGSADSLSEGQRTSHPHVLRFCTVISMPLRGRKVTNCSGTTGGCRGAIRSW